MTCAQSVVEMFLGLRLGVHFPSVRVPYSEQPAAGADSCSEDGSDAEEDSSLKLAAARQARCCIVCCPVGMCRHGKTESAAKHISCSKQQRFT